MPVSTRTLVLPLTPSRTNPEIRMFQLRISAPSCLNSTLKRYSSLPRELLLLPFLNHKGVHMNDNLIYYQMHPTLTITKAAPTASQHWPPSRQLHLLAPLCRLAARRSIELVHSSRPAACTCAAAAVRAELAVTGTANLRKRLLLPLGLLRRHGLRHRGGIDGCEGYLLT